MARALDGRENIVFSQDRPGKQVFESRYLTARIEVVMVCRLKAMLKKTAHLARLHMEDAELSRLIDKAEHILKYIEKLDELDTKNLEATSHATELVNAFREDCAIPFSAPELITAQSPDSHDNLYQVPRVIEES